MKPRSKTLVQRQDFKLNRSAMEESLTLNPSTKGMIIPFHDTSGLKLRFGTFFEIFDQDLAVSHEQLASPVHRAGNAQLLHGIIIWNREP